MQRSYEEIYAVAEERHPWFVARRELFAALAGDDKKTRILDVGCGTGIFLSHLKALGFEHLAGVEISDNLRAKFRDPEIQLFDRLPDGVWDKVFMLDVLEHIEDDRGTLAEVIERLAPGGRFYASVPAHPFLWSRHDEINLHHRRYRRRELEHKLTAAGFRLLKLSYWNLSGLPPAFLARMLRRDESSTDFELGGSWALKLYGGALRLENRLLRVLSLPMGVSLVVIAQRPTPKSIVVRSAATEGEQT